MRWKYVIFYPEFLGSTPSLGKQFFGLNYKLMNLNFEKLSFSFLLVLLLLCGHIVAQEKQPYFQLEKHITQKDYQQGVMLLRLKPEYRQAFKGTSSREKTMSRLKQELGIREIQPIVPEQVISQANQRRQKPPVVDLSTMYVLHFDPQVPVEDAINRMYATGMVVYAEPSYVRKAHYIPNDAQVTRQHYLSKIQAYEAWDISQGSRDIVIGIVDSGIDKDHEDLVNKKAMNEDEIPDNGIDDDNDGYVDNVWGWDFIGEDINDIQQDNDPGENPENGISHGTYVAGCAVADTDNGRGIAGVGFNTRFLVTKHSYAGDTANSIYGGYQGISYMANQGVDIINLSYGGPGRNQFVQDLIDYAVLDQGCLVVASAGNEGESTENYPAAYDHVLSVTAVNRDDTKASFSNTAHSVDISAPGTRILTTAAGGGYTSVQGTSFAAPIVSGAASLVKAIYPDMSGMQIGEILRVTADESIYEEPENPENRMGKGRLNILRALTEQSPSIRMQNSSITNAAGGVTQEGDTVLITAEFVNYLWPSGSGLTASLSTTSPYAEVLENNIPLGVLGMNDTITNEQSPFRIFISEDTPENTNIDLIVEYQDGTYQDYEHLSILVNPSYMNIQENRVSTSITSNGRIGFQDSGLDTREEGLGFIFEDTNLLFEMGLMLGTSADRISNAVRAEEGAAPDDDFKPLEEIRKMQPGKFSYAEVKGSFNDEKADAARSDVTVNFRTMVWIEEPDNNYIIVQYTIRNDGKDTLSSFYAGLYADWDIGEGGGKDKADWNEENNVGYVYSAEEEGRLFAAIQELSGNPNYFAIDNDPDIPDNPFGVYDDFTDEEKFKSMSGGIDRKKAGASTAEGNDVSHTVASGPYTILPGDSVRIAFALHGALSMDELLASSRAAAEQYHLILQVPKPEVEDVMVCYGDTAVLEASGAGEYHWYSTKTGGEPVGEGPAFRTGPITKDTLFFVSNVQDTVESVRAEAKVSLALSPEAEFQVEMPGSTIDEQEEVHFVDQSRGEVTSWMWDFGDNTSSTEQNPVHQYEEEGEYTVALTVTNASGCTSTFTRTLGVITSVEEEIAERESFIFPNPASSAETTLFMKDTMTAPLRLWIISGEGKVVRSFQVKQGIYDNLRINVEGLVPGTYFMQVEATDGVAVHRLLVIP